MEDSSPVRPAITEARIKEIFRDYNIKINEKMSKMGELPVSAQDINNMIVLLNWCFQLKNNFFTKDFNKRSIYGINLAYKQLKTNILLEDEAAVSFFDNITTENLKVLKYILNQYVSIFDEIDGDGYHNEICSRVSKDSVKRCVQFVGSHVAAAA
jgi:hypothetical protein